MFSLYFFSTWGLDEYENESKIKKKEGGGGGGGGLISIIIEA